MEQYKNETLEAAKARIAVACEEYVSDKIDEDGVRDVLSAIPEALWADESAALSMVTILVEDDELYDKSLEEDKYFAEFICGFLPEAFWNNRDGILSVTGLIVDSLISWCSFASFSDFTDVLRFVPDCVRQDRAFLLSIIEIVAARENSLDWNGGFDDLISDSFLSDKDSLLAVVMYIMRAKQSNAADFWMVPTAAWEYQEIVFWILENFRDEYESDHYLFTMYPVFRGSVRDYLESFIQFIPDKFKSDKEFILEFLREDYFASEFDLLYDWMDKDLWYDKELVLKALESDVTSVVYVPKEMSKDKEIKNYIDENIDFDWDLSEIPEEKIPQWIKELKE